MRMQLGMGEFVPGGFPVPQNPIGLAGYRGMGDFAPACFPVPQNPIGMSGLSGLSGCGGSCGCGGKCSTGMQGVMEDIGNAFSGAAAGVQGAFSQLTSGGMWTYIALGGAALLAFGLLTRGSEYRSASRALSAEYKAKRAKLKAQYGRGYQRAGRAARAAREAF